jgi:hypothetical protein
LPERNHSRADSSMYTGATVQLDTRSQSLMSPGECIKFKPDDLSFERRSDMRFEYAHYKKGGNMDLKTATLASLVHKFKTDSSLGPNQGWRMVDGLATRISARFSFEYASTTRRMQSTRCVMVYGRTMRRQYVVSTSKDVLTSWLKIPDRDEIRERTHNVHMAQLVMYSKESSPGHLVLSTQS